MPIKPLLFKGDKKPKKRKHRETLDDGHVPSTSTSLIQTTSPDNDELPDPTSDETAWTTPDTASDLSGPVLIVLPTNPPTCLASDAHGNVFASAIENIVDDHAETAEPHDVRQVWVVNSVAGTGTITFKASHGGFLSCDTLGVLGARREARGVEEGFIVEETDEKNKWRIRTAATKKADGETGKRYLCIVVEGSTATNGDEDDNGSKRKKISISLRGDGEAKTDGVGLILKMQLKFKPSAQQSKETKAKEKVSRRELEQVVGRKLEDHEVKRLKRAKKDGTYYEEILDVRVKGKHDKFAS